MTLICAYAPHSGYSAEAKEEFYDQLSTEFTAATWSEVILMLGSIM